MPEGTVQRPELLRVLEAVAPGLSFKDMTRQSGCFAFKNGHVHTYNDQVSCRAHSPLEGLEAAVTASSLLAMLRAMSAPELGWAADDKELVLSAPDERPRFGLDPDGVVLPIESVDVPPPDDAAWADLAHDFADAVKMVKECVGKDRTKFAITCVHVHPKWVEACDAFRITRYTLDTNFPAPVLVAPDALAHATAADCTRFALTNDWVHFCNPAGLVVSCRRYSQPYPDFAPILDVKGGTPIRLPQGIARLCERAEVFSSENSDRNEVLVEIEPGKVRISSTGVSGRYIGRKRMEYAGEKKQFSVSPRLLKEVVNRGSVAVITDDRLKVESDKWRFVASL